MGIKLKSLIIVSAVAALTALGWYVYALQNQLEEAEESEKRTSERLEASERNRKISEAMQAGYALVEQIQNERLSDARSKINDLRGRVASGAVELRVNAECPSDSPGTAGAVTSNDGPAPRLTGAARQAYYTLRDRAEVITAQVRECQGYVRVVREKYEELRQACDR